MGIGFDFPRLRLTAVVLVAILALWAGLSQQPLAASAPSQSDGEPITVTEKGCDFDYDYDADGQPNGPFDPADGDYLPQDAWILGHCWFQVSVIVAANIRFESELVDWDGDVDLERVARQHSEPQSVNAGSSDIHIGEGGYRINIKLRGRTPRGFELKSLNEEYSHDLQIPRQFKLVNITVTTDAGDKEWVESHDVSSASAAYIEAHSTIVEAENTSENPLPPSVMTLGRQLLDEGYPQIALRVVALEFQTDDNDANGGILPVWVWVAIIIAVVLLALGAVAVWLIMRKPSLDDD